MHFCLHIAAEDMGSNAKREWAEIEIADRNVYEHVQYEWVYGYLLQTGFDRTMG